MEKFLAEIGLERFATNLKGFELRDLALFDGHDWRSLGIPETSDKVKIKRALEKKLAPNNERSGPHAAHSMATTTADTYTDANLRTVGVPQEQMGSDKLCMIRNVIADCVAQHVASEENTHDLSSYMKDMQDLINTHATMPNTTEQYKNLQTYFNNKFDHDTQGTGSSYCLQNDL